MVKQAIFNLARADIQDALVIDLFAGAGPLAIEALSRGASGVVFVDREPRGLAILRQNLEALGLKERARVVRGDVVRWLETSPGVVREASFIFLDPPYDDPVLDRALKVLDRGVEGATVIAEHSRRQELPHLTR